MPSQHTVVVGGSSGIGLATAQHLVDAGGRVTITGRSENRLAAAWQRLGTEARAMQMDASEAETVPAQFARIGKFDHLVLALGSGKGFGPLATVSLADVRRGFEEKVFAHFATAQAALPYLNPTGSITFVAAVSAHAAMPGTAGTILAAELKPMRLNAVSPGVVDTPWWEVFPEDQKLAMFKEYAAKTPVGRVGQPEDIAQAISFLIGNGFMTGHTLICDGGLRLAA